MLGVLEENEEEETASKGEGDQPYYCIQDRRTSDFVLR